VVADTPTFALNEPERTPKLFMPMTAVGGPDGTAFGPGINDLTYVVRAPVSTANLLMPIRAAIDEVDPKLALSQVRSLQDIVDQSAAPMAFTMVLLVIAAAVTLLLGSWAFTASCRTSSASALAKSACGWRSAKRPARSPRRSFARADSLRSAVSSLAWAPRSLADA
jgi:hypothetical protein